MSNLNKRIDSATTIQTMPDEKMMEIANYYLKEEETVDKNLIDDILSFSISFLRTLPSPIKCFCPTNSSKFLGLKREANG